MSASVSDMCVHAATATCAVLGVCAAGACVGACVSASVSDMCVHAATAPCAVLGVCAAGACVGACVCE